MGAIYSGGWSIVGWVWEVLGRGQEGVGFVIGSVVWEKESEPVGCAMNGVGCSGRYNVSYKVSSLDRVLEACASKGDLV